MAIYLLSQTATLSLSRICINYMVLAPCSNHY